MSNINNSINHSNKNNNDRDLELLEQQLINEVDADLFEEPKSFRTLHRVIDILGAQLLDDDPLQRTNNSSANNEQSYENLTTKNPAYLALLKQKSIVESAIEHMSINHCSELNGSVVSVGNVARQFSDAVNRVRNLRKQVKDIKRQLHHSDVGASNHQMNGKTNQLQPNDSSNYSLRELWLKKLESEAVLTLLSKLEIIREAPTAFDSLIMPCEGQCRIGAAVTLLSNAINTMFSDDVAQIQALTKIMDQLMTRKQKAEEIVWDTLHDIVYLRTGNRVNPTLNTASINAPNHPYHGQKEVSAVPGGNVYKNRIIDDDGMHEVFFGADYMNELDDDEASVASTFSGFSHPSMSDSQSSHNINPNKPTVTGRMIPQSIMETELDLEEDELLCLEEEQRGSQGVLTQSSAKNDQHLLPRYSDPTQALRILVETIAKLGRLDDIERFLNESLEREIRSTAEQEQKKTLALLERRKHKRTRNREFRDTAPTALPYEFKHHLRSLLYSFGNVMLRLSHLAQILRTRIISDPQIITPSYSPPSTALHGIINAAYSIMQREIKSYLCACLAIADNSAPTTKQNQQSGLYDSKVTNNVSSLERGIFSLGIIDKEALASPRSTKNLNRSITSSSSGKDLPAGQFVINVLVPMTNTLPQLRYALSFRKGVERWTRDNNDLKKELASVTKQDTTLPSYNIRTEETALDFLDKVIEKEVLPVLQDLAVNCTVAALEREDAFEPRHENIYSRTSTRQSEITPSIACTAVLESTTPLFSALQRLPQGSNMYTPLVAVLDYSLLAFISRVKQRVEDICMGKKASELLDNGGDEKGGISAAMEYRKAYSLLLQEYGERPDVMTSTSLQTASASSNQIKPLSPSTSDTQARYLNNDEKNETKEESKNLDPINDLEREDDALEKEIPHLLSLLQFGQHNYGESLNVCTDEELMQAAFLAHSLLKFANLLEKRLQNKGGKWAKTTTRALREAVRNIKQHGNRMAKFCRIDMLVQVVKRMSKICQSSAIFSKDQIRLPLCVNDLGEYFATISDTVRETSGNSIAAYAFSSLEQYIPLLLMQTVRRIGKGEVPTRNALITMNGVEALDRSGSVLYRDLKGATSFEGSFWDDAAAADAFERSASFIALLELSMDELKAYCRNNRSEFSDGDYKLLFSMNGPRRKANTMNLTAL